MDHDIIVLSDELEKEARIKAECFPVDRYFIDAYLSQILSLDRNEFILCNLERMSNTYTVQLFLCLPELWNDVTVDDLVVIMSKFTNNFSYYTAIEFTYKYVEVNIIELILNLQFVPKDIKNDILDYLVSSFYPNLVKTEGDYLFFDEGLYGVKSDDWVCVKERLLVDKRIQPAYTTLKEVKNYVDSLQKKYK